MSGEFIQAEFRGISWIEPYPIQQYCPDPAMPFSIELALLIGPKDLPGEELFLVDISNALFIAQEIDELGPRLLATTIVMREFSVAAVERIVRDFCTKCRGKTWHDVALLLMRLGRWEFEGMATP